MIEVFLVVIRFLFLFIWVFSRIRVSLMLGFEIWIGLPWKSVVIYLMSFLSPFRSVEIYDSYLCMSSFLNLSNYANRYFIANSLLSISSWFSVTSSYGPFFFPSFKGTHSFCISIYLFLYIVLGVSYNDRDILRILSPIFAGLRANFFWKLFRKESALFVRPSLLFCANISS